MSVLAGQFLDRLVQEVLRILSNKPSKCRTASVNRNEIEASHRTYDWAVVPHNFSGIRHTRCYELIRLPPSSPKLEGPKRCLGDASCMNLPAKFAYNYVVACLGPCDGASYANYNASLIPIVMHYLISIIKHLNPNLESFSWRRNSSHGYIDADMHDARRGSNLSSVLLDGKVYSCGDRTVLKLFRGNHKDLAHNHSILLGFGLFDILESLYVDTI
ncbi:hypothetical protein KC328_g28 [Hortaea werneckii]|nr:hypothetical protein KC328_g28 [Hortaea werneckii]